MKYILKITGFYLLFLLLLIFICSFLNLLGINSTITSLIMFIFNIIAFSISGFKLGKKTNKKGFIEGFKIGIIYCFILAIFKIISLHKLFSITTFIYYIILLLSSILGAILGINKKESNKK